MMTMYRMMPGAVGSGGRQFRCPLLFAPQCGDKEKIIRLSNFVHNAYVPHVNDGPPYVVKTTTKTTTHPDDSLSSPLHGYHG